VIRIGIDAHGLGGHSLGLGNESYFKYLIKGLVEIDDRNEYHIFVNHSKELAAIVAGRPNVRLISLWPQTQWVQRPFSLPVYVARHRLDVLHCPFIRPPVVSARTIVTVHDACFEEYPQHFRRHELWRMRFLVPRSCRTSDLIFTVSEYARDQLHRLYGVPHEKMVITYNAADHTGPLGHGPWPAPAGLERVPYILYVGLVQPRKNLARLVEAFDRVRDRGLPHHLVLAGRRGWGNEALEAVVERSPYRDAIHFPGYVRHETFASLMSNASAFAFPSEFESFGIPPMEAQRWGVPALVSNNTCFPEIYGDSVTYCDPLDVASIADVLYRLLTDGQLRDRVRMAGLERSGRYTWQSTAAVARRAYESLQASHRPEAVA
jgi:glycosyltransferase involved in cell wall biosynthesis